MQFYPDLTMWAAQESRMFKVLKPHIQPLINRLALPDLLLAAYLLGLNHMQIALDKTVQETEFQDVGGGI
jgi:hypothetical protein